MKLRFRIFSMVALAFFAWTNPALAVPCSDPASGIFLGSIGDTTTSASSACVDGGNTNDPFPNALTAFGEDYAALAKWLEETAPGSGIQAAPSVLVDVGFSAGGFASENGTWALTNPGTYTDFVIVLKDGGADGAGTDKWSGYQLNTSLFADFATNGASGWWQYSTDPAKAISHIAIYGREGSSTVPEPGTLALLGIGLFGMGLARRRKAV
jgi:hypothetical protein